MNSPKTALQALVRGQTALFATVLTLGVVPILYAVFFRVSFAD